VGKNKDKEREFRLRPRKPAARGERRVYASAYKIIMHHARMIGVRKRRVVGFGTGTTRTRPYSQRCAVRVLYSKNTSKGQWRAHGCYVARESATHDGDPASGGFSTSQEGIDIAIRLEEWQKASEERMWKLIVSPEFGDRVDLKRLTRDLMSEMQTDLATPLEWIAVAHYNTEHPHVHISLRCRSRRKTGSSQPGLHPRRHSRSRGESMHSPAWVSQGVRCSRRAAKGSPPAPLYFA
jgi:type IV secretory pathway VirD2 relaxase